MKRRRITAGHRAIDGRAAPVEIQLWEIGANPTDYGVHIWNERSVNEAVGRYEARGNPIVVDVEHLGTRTEDGQPTVTGGYCRLEVRGGAPWLIFSWSDYGTEQIETGQRRFLSPEYDVDKDTGEILALYRVSLVADPGTHRARQLASALSTKGNPMDPMVLAALRAALESDDPKASIESLLAQLESAGGGTAEAPAAAAAPEEEKAPTAAAAPEEEKAPMAAAAEEEKPIAATVKPKTDARVALASASAVRQIQDAQRDHLMTTQGERLEPSIRRWASAQPLDVVRGLLAATPAKDATPVRVAATRGSVVPVEASADKSLEDQIFAGLGLHVQTYRAPFKRSDGCFVFPVNKPSAVRAHIAARAAEKAG